MTVVHMGPPIEKFHTYQYTRQPKIYYYYYYTLYTAPADRLVVLGYKRFTNSSTPYACSFHSSYLHVDTSIVLELGKVRATIEGYLFLSNKTIKLITVRFFVDWICIVSAFLAVCLYDFFTEPKQTNNGPIRLWLVKKAP